MKKQLLLLTTLLVAFNPVRAQQPPVLLKDINTENAAQGTYNVDPANFCSLNNLTYFTAYTPNFGRQIWQTDGTNAGTRPLTHSPELNWSVLSAPAYEIPAMLTAMNGNLYFFTANKNEVTQRNTFNLVKSDVNGNITRLATSSENTLLHDRMFTVYNQGTNDAARKKIVVHNNNLYFAFSDPQHGAELWKSDGTKAGTNMLLDITSGTGSAAPMNFAVANSYVFFTVLNAGKQDLWRTDGTTGGTIKLRDSVATGNNLRCMNVVNNKLYFISNNSNTATNYVWQSDGTVAGTSIVAQAPGSFIYSYLMKQGNNVIYYLTPATGLVKYDGTSPTQLSTTIRPYTPYGRSNGWADVNGTLFFSVLNTGGTGYYSIWKTDGTTAGTVKVKDTISSFNYLNANGTLYFAGNDSSGNGMELWKSNGTTAGTVRLSNFNTSALFGGDGITDLLTEYAMTVQNGKVLLSAFNGTLTAGQAAYPNTVLAASDGTTSGTVLLSPTFTATYDSYPSERIVWNNALYFSAFNHTHGYEFWKTDGTPAGTVFMGDLMPGTQSSYIEGFMPYKNKLYFCTSDSSNGHMFGALWQSDGTPAGTVKVKDSLGNSRYGINKLDTLNGKLIIAAEGAVYVSDGTSAGTVRIPTLAPGATQESAIGNFAFLNGNMVMTARGANSTIGPDEVWQANLTSNTASRIATGLVFHQEIVTFNNAVYFVKEKAVNQYNYALWKTDGTIAGTTIVDTSFYPRHLQLFDNNATLYYTSVSNPGNKSYLRKITMASGVPETVKTYNDYTIGDYIYKNEYAYYNFTIPQVTTVKYSNNFPLYPYFIKVNSNSPIFFPGGDSTTGGELIQTDGTTNGTSLVKDILSGARSGNIQYLTHMINKQGDSIIAFVANDDMEGNEIWISDGTAAGTKNLVHTMPGTNTMNPQQLIWLNNKLIFWGNALETGNEPYVYELFQVLKTDDITANNNTLALYPNPASNMVHVIAASESDISLYSVTGARLYENHVTAGVATVPVGHLPPGIYTIRSVNSKGKILYGKFVKQ